jgi:hypothetical protein
MSKFQQYYYQIKESYETMFSTPSDSRAYFEKETFEVYKNPTEQDLDELYSVSLDNGIRMGIDKTGTIYAWTDAILHTDAERLLQKDFVLKLEYTKNRDKIFLSTAEVINSKDELLKVLDKSKLAKIKLLFPEVKSIEMNRRPFTKLYDYEEKQTFNSLKHTGIEEWVKKLSLLELREYSKKHPKLTDDTKKMLERERILRTMERTKNK